MKRTYTIPLRSAFRNRAKYKKTPTAVRAVQNFLMKHMKVEDVKLGKNLNMAIWANGIKNPPAKVKVDVEKKDNVAYAELSGKAYDEPTKSDLEAEQETKAPKNPLEAAQQKLAGKDKPKKEEKAPEEEKTEEKPVKETKVEKTPSKE